MQKTSEKVRRIIQGMLILATSKKNMPEGIDLITALLLLIITLAERANLYLQ